MAESHDSDRDTFTRILVAIAANDVEPQLTRTEIDQLADEFRATIRAKRRAARSAQMKERVRPSILVLARDAVERWISEIVAVHPTAVIAHRDLTELSDDDLRTALEDALTLIERMS